MYKIRLRRGGYDQYNPQDYYYSYNSSNKHTIPSTLRAPPLAKVRSSAKAEHYSQRLNIYKQNLTTNLIEHHMF